MVFQLGVSRGKISNVHGPWTQPSMLLRSSSSRTILTPSGGSDTRVTASFESSLKAVGVSDSTSASRDVPTYHIERLRRWCVSLVNEWDTINRQWLTLNQQKINKRNQKLTRSFQSWFTRFPCVSYSIQTGKTKDAMLKMQCHAMLCYDNPRRCCLSSECLTSIWGMISPSSSL